ncbi:MAG TPA: cupin domain-containing protein [Acidobacteriota bacterium]|nr:cupin domain-containing protein [Acidobacteriota bacterium]
MPFVNLKDCKEKEPIPGYRGRFIHCESMTIGYWDIDEGAVAPEHTHPHEQVVNVIEGRLELTVDGQAQVLEPGLAAVVPGNVPHSAKALSRCRTIEAFCPVREDLR